MRVKRTGWMGVILLLLTAWGIWPSGLVQAAVVISSYTANPGNAQVILRWETASEMSVSGFYIQRSTQVDGAYTRVSNFFIGMGDGVSGSLYEYTDTGLTNGVTYYYKLEVLDTNQFVEFYGPLSAVPGLATPTNTPTLTLTPTPTITRTVAISPTSTRTVPPVIGNTPTPVNGYPVVTAVSATSTQWFSLSTPGNGLSTEQPSPTPVFQFPTLILVTEVGRATSVDRLPDEATPATGSTPDFVSPLDETLVDNIFDSDLVLWSGIIVGGLVLGGIAALVLWSLSRRVKAG